jgi:ATP-dependent RNA helicase RhlE
VGRTGRVAATGDAYTFVAPEDESEIARIERVMGRRIERRKLAGFNYQAAAAEKLEVPLAERIAAARAARRLKDTTGATFSRGRRSPHTSAASGGASPARTRRPA